MTSTRRALLLTLLGVAYLAEAAGKQNVQQRLPLYPSEDGSIALARTATLASETYKEPLLVSLLDGKVIAVDRDTGRKLWTFDSGEPLLSASGPAEVLTPERSNQPAVQNYGPLVIPSVDGDLYSYQHGADHLQKLPGSVADMANGFPSRTPDGALVKGSNFGGFLVLDPETGEILRDPPGNAKDFVAETAEGESPRRYVVGWQRYTVHSVDEVTYETRWNVIYTRMRGVGPNEGKLSDLTGLESSSNGTLLRRDRRTGEVMWDLQLSSPAVTAFMASGAEVSLEVAASHSEPAALPALPEGRIARPQLDGEASRSKIIMVDRGSGGYYALPAPRGHSSTGLALPPQEAPSLALEVGDEPVTVVAEDCGDMWQCPLGAHQIKEAPTQDQILFLPSVHTRNDSPARESRVAILPSDSREESADGEGADDDDGSWNRSVMGWLQVGAGALVGAALFGMLTHQYDVGKPRLWTTLDKKHMAEGIVTMEMSYTGSQQEARDAAEAALKNEQDARAATPQLSTIRDHTGSGVGNDPDENARRARKRWKKARDTRFSNKMMGAIKESALEGDSRASLDEEEEDEQDEDEDLGIDEDRLAPMQAAAGDNTAHSSGRSSTVQSREVARAGVSRVGRMEIGPEILGYGSSGTLVFEGTLHGRPIAVKRILSQFYELARKEIGALILSDEHPNIVRCFAMEEDNEFVYLALERCRQSLNDLVNSEDGPANFLDDARRPTPFCMQVVEEAGHGLVALHQRGIVHRDIKPQNILLTESRHAKLSDMGLCKRLAIDQSSFESRGPGGSTGWQAPEQLISRSGGDVRQGKSVDIFSFGLVIFYCLTGGKHAFGESYERDFNILQGRASLREVAHLKEAENLVRAMLVPAPKRRPSIASVMAHPFWWPPQRRLSFLVDLSDRMENEDREEDQSLLAALEACSEEALGGRNWMARLDPDFLENLGRYRKYRPDSLRDLLRVIRNKHNHFRELPEPLQAKLGPMPEGFLSYFSSRFPNLLMATFCFGLHRCAEEPMLAKYYPAGALEFPLELMSTRLAAATGAPATAANTVDAIRGVQKRALSMPLPGARQAPLFPEPVAAADAPGAPRAKSAPEASVAPTASSATPASREPGSSQGSPFTSSGLMHMRHSASPPFAQGPASAGVSGRSSGEINGLQAPRNGFIHRTPPLPPPQHRSSSPSNSARSSVSGRSVYSAQQPPPPPSLQRSSPSGSVWSMSGSSMLGPNWAYMPPPSQSDVPPHMQPQRQHGPRTASALDRLRGGSSSLSSSVASEASFGAAPPSQHSTGSSGHPARDPSHSGSPPQAGFLSDGVPPAPSSMEQQEQDGRAAQVQPPLQPIFPCRPGQPLCDFYTKTGHCKFGEACKFDHPAHFGVQLNTLGLPLRQGENVCSHFEKTRTCKFGPACKFHHPEPLHGA